MTVIYLFVSPSGRAYAGRHTCQHEGWPRRGSGALPSGYRGSGKLWANVTRRHGPAIRWIILRRFGPDALRVDIDEAERRAIRLARAMWAERCMNRAEGGTGNTSADALSLWADPESAVGSPSTNARRRAALKAITKTQEGAAVLARAQAAAHSPEAIARQKARAQTPEGRAQLMRAWAAAASPEARAKVAATRARNKALRAMETQQ